jgi:TetR/AcrR family transcriptional repressor of nem operon
LKSNRLEFRINNRSNQRRRDICKASIQHHFPTKADLAIAVVQQSHEMFDADMASLQPSGADAVAQLCANIAYWERCIADDSAPFA